MKLFTRKHYMPWFERKAERNKATIDMVLPAEIDRCLAPHLASDERVCVLVTNQLDPRRNGVYYMERVACLAVGERGGK